MKYAASLTVLLLGIGLSGPLYANAADDPCDACGKPTAWDGFNGTDLKVVTSQGQGYGSWSLRFDTESNDILVDADLSDGVKTLRGRIMMIGGRVMATQGPITESGVEIDAVDAPLLMRMLVTRLLGRSLPDGPESIKGTRNIDFKDEKTAIQFATPSAQGFIPAPWHVRGEVNVISPERVDFDLTLTVQGGEQSPAGSGNQEQRFVGNLSKVVNAKIEDTTSLEGWEVFGVGVQMRQSQGSTMVDYGAAPSRSNYRTVADIRRELAADDFPGEPDPNLDFTGFWKGNCDDPFGLQIMRYGDEGKYSVVFCGPGGCGTSGQAGRNTFITKDSHYMVVSSDEIKIRTTESGWDLYHRCTTDPHPVLRYKEASKQR